ncbi:hypothetical protein [Streptomyces sp. NPDC058424]|uniref:hypothetical protein n=1 Tax=Streptomyces sp. NPDC058424 TaxID=3346491 RepID=UPI00366885FA
MSGKVADFLRTADLEPAEPAALGQGVTVRRRQGYTQRVTAVPGVHRQLLARCQPFDGGQGTPGGPGTAQGPPRVRNPRQRPRLDRTVIRVSGYR